MRRALLSKLVRAGEAKFAHRTRAISQAAAALVPAASQTHSNLIASSRRCLHSSGLPLRRYRGANLAANSTGESAAGPAATGAILLDGTATSQVILDTIAAHITRVREGGVVRPPSLAVLLPNSTRESERYVQRKAEVASQVGITSTTYRFDREQVTKDDIIARIKQLNEDPTVDGILVQLPLPAQCMKFEATILAAVNPAKDVDGFHPSNMGNLAALAAHQGGAHARAARTEMTEEDLAGASAKVVRHVPCTPKACLELIDRYNIDLTGKHVVIFGRSATVGLPLTLMLFNRPAAVTNIDEHLDVETARRLCAMADVIMVGVGQPEYIRADWVKPGAVIIDVGINFVPKVLTDRAAALENPLDAKDNVRLCGDVAFDECAEKASYITPVPGGVGPMTVAMLMESTLRSYLYHVNK